jgi:hypothetical protein
MAVKSKNKKSITAAAQARRSRAARILDVSPRELDALAKGVERTLKSLGRVKKHTNGRLIVYARKPVPLQFINARHVVRLKALVKDAIDCPIAKCGKDPDACWLAAYATSVHVGNAIMTFWSELCPHITVKFMLPTQLKEAIRDWDAQVKADKKDRRFRLEDGVYFLAPWPKSLEHDSEGPRVRNVGIRGKNERKPTRRLTVRSDLSLAFAASKLAAAKKKSKTA